MSRHWAIKAIVTIGAAGWVMTGAVAKDVSDGRWSMQPSEKPGMVQFSLHSASAGFTHVTNRPTRDFTGLDLAKDTEFTLVRDAGKFEFAGALSDGSGAGSFKFVPDARYPQEMKALGFDGVTEEQVQFAIHDVSLNFAREMKSANLQNLDSDKLVAFRIHGVSRKFIDDIQAAGLNERDSDQLIAFRIHGVTPELVKRVSAAGYTVDSESLVALRIHGATPEYMDDLKKRGYGGIPLEQVVEFRIHGVTPDFIDGVQKLGFQHPEPKQLVTMRIHGVTPEYIAQLQTRGVKNLTIDKLVAMKIHDID
jgi:hypothetical protein